MTASWPLLCRSGPCWLQLSAPDAMGAATTTIARPVLRGACSIHCATWRCDSPGTLWRRYFKYTRMTLPLEYNALVEHVIWYRRRGGDDVTTEAEEEQNSTARRSGLQAPDAATAAHPGWGRGRKLAGMHVFEEPEDAADWHWRYVPQPDALPIPRGVRYEARTLGGRPVRVLHFAVEAKPWLPRPSCQAAGHLGVPSTNDAARAVDGW